MLGLEITVLIVTILIGIILYGIQMVNIKGIKNLDIYNNNVEKIEKKDRVTLENKFKKDLAEGLIKLSKDYSKKYGEGKFKEFYIEYDKLLKQHRKRKIATEQNALAKKYGNLYTEFNKDANKIYTKLLAQFKIDIKEIENESKSYFQKYGVVTFGIAIIFIAISIFAINNNLLSYLLSKGQTYMYETRSAIYAEGINFTNYSVSWIFIALMASLIISSIILSRFLIKEGDSTFRYYIGSVDKSKKSFTTLLLVLIAFSIYSFLLSNAYVIYNEQGIYINKPFSYGESVVETENLDNIYHINKEKNGKKTVKADYYIVKSSDKENFVLKSQDKKVKEYIDKLSELRNIKIEEVELQSDIK